MRVVLDANVIVSGISRYDTGQSPPVRALRHAVDRDFLLNLSEPVLDEVRAALEKSYFGDRLEDQYREEKLQDIRSVAHIVDPDEGVRGIASHWQVDLVLATAVSGEAAFLVTGDKELLALEHPYPFRIVHPGLFLEILASAS